MDLKQLLTQARARLDDTAVPYLWSDPFLTEAYNEAIDEACIRTRGILDSTTTSLCVVQANPNQQRYKLDSHIIKVERVRMASDPTPLEFTTLRWLDEHVQFWDSALHSGQPQWYFTNQDRGKQLVLGLAPYPRVADNMLLSVWRMPLDNEYLVKLADCPPLPGFLHRGLVNWVEHLAYSVKDSELRDDELAQRAEQRFTAQFGERPSGHGLKLMSANAARPVRGCYF